MSVPDFCPFVQFVSQEGWKPRVKSRIWTIHESQRFPNRLAAFVRQRFSALIFKCQDSRSDLPPFPLPPFPLNLS